MHFQSVFPFVYSTFYISEERIGFQAESSSIQEKDCQPRKHRHKKNNEKPLIWSKLFHWCAKLWNSLLGSLLLSHPMVMWYMSWSTEDKSQLF